MRNIKSAIPSITIEDIVDSMPKGNNYPWITRNPEQITEIIIHHFASEASLLANANYHINGRGWRALGYHVVIDKTRILQTNDLLHQTTHCAGHNEKSIGISIRGDLSKREMTPTERELLYAAIITVKGLFPNAVVIGHNEATGKTSCPCTSMKKIREGVATLELSQALEGTPNDLLAKAVAVSARVEDLRKIAYDPKHKYNAEGLKKMNRIHDILVEEGIL